MPVQSEAGTPALGPSPYTDSNGGPMGLKGKAGTQPRVIGVASGRRRRKDVHRRYLSDLVR